VIVRYFPRQVLTRGLADRRWRGGVQGGEAEL
jgi:hypothetical protein